MCATIARNVQHERLWTLTSMRSWGHCCFMYCIQGLLIVNLILIMVTGIIPCIKNEFWRQDPFHSYSCTAKKVSRKYADFDFAIYFCLIKWCMWHNNRTKLRYHPYPFSMPYRHIGLLQTWIDTNFRFNIFIQGHPVDIIDVKILKLNTKSIKQRTLFY